MIKEFKTEELKVGDIISLRAGLQPAPLDHFTEWSRLAIFEITNRLIRTVILLDRTDGFAPGTLYNFQIIDLERALETGARWRLLCDSK